MERHWRISSGGVPGSDLCLKDHSVSYVNSLYEKGKPIRKAIRNNLEEKEWFGPEWCQWEVARFQKDSEAEPIKLTCRLDVE